MTHDFFNGRTASPVCHQLGCHRRGFTLIEATVAVVLLMVAMTTTLQAVSWIARERQSLDRRAMAIRETEHLLDRLVRSGANPNVPLVLSSEGEQALPDGTILVDRVDEAQGGVTMQHITVTLRYQDRPGVPASAVRLSTWIVRNKESKDSSSGEPAP
ncbi:type IV pilus modification PilV family protein [Tautonia rosea]|uniref:type IV pilus modification PilV family protein n=1 Tax=Tautonia rosea TaxID=2728037 RepID=UPI001475A45D|nr:type II secretion system protein [Tautonia rosea]